MTGLSIAIVVVVILLLSCWNKPMHQRQKLNRPNLVQQPHVQHRRRQMRPAHQHLKPDQIDENILSKSEYGSGVYDEKSSKRYEELSNIQGYDDYNTVVQYMSVEPEVYDSHERYSKDMGRSTAGASMMSVRDDPNDVVPWVARKPFYQDSYSQAGARQEPSEYPDQMREKTYYVIG